MKILDEYKYLLSEIMKTDEKSEIVQKMLIFEKSLTEWLNLFKSLLGNIIRAEVNTVNFISVEEELRKLEHNIRDINSSKLNELKTLLRRRNHLIEEINELNSLVISRPEDYESEKADLVYSEKQVISNRIHTLLDEIGL